MKKINFSTVVGFLVCATIVFFNVRHALNDYGIRDNKELHEQVLAQANSSGNASGRGSNTNGYSTGGDDDEFCPLVTEMQSINNKFVIQKHYTGDYGAPGALDELKKYQTKGVDCIGNDNYIHCCWEPTVTTFIEGMGVVSCDPSKCLY